MAGNKERLDLVACWNVPLADGVHTIEFEHGTATGKRVLRVDGREILRRDWMFKLVGDEVFEIGKQNTKCVLKVDPVPFFSFSYSLVIDGKPLEKFFEKQSRLLKAWSVTLGNRKYGIILEKHTLDVWINGQRVEAESAFVEDGTEIQFEIEGANAVIKATSATKKGLVYELYVNEELVTDEVNF